MNTIYDKDQMYMSDEQSFIVSEFDYLTDELQYTLDFNTKGGLSIFSNIYDTEHPKDAWSITLEQDNLFYTSLLELIGITYQDTKLPGRTVNISLVDNNIVLSFTCPYDETGVVNIRISEDDPNREKFIQVLASLNEVFTRTKKLATK